ncbi:MAG: DUF4062 domain-containing protein [Treponema sp.]|nr:DUF4062 domain-containing protein [Treponema sp.]
MFKKYQIYFSSALDDLKNERKELLKIITELGAIPVSMENFDINSAEDLELIKKAIQESDYFVNLIAYKCGPAAGKTFSAEIEYTWAQKFQVPVLSFIIDEKARWKASKKEKSKESAKALEHFKKRLRENHAINWTTTADLCQKAYTCLVREMNLNPRQGWVRGNDSAMPVTANELARLSSENDYLRSRMRIQGSDTSPTEEQIKHCLKVLAANKISLSFWYTTSENWEDTMVIRYIKLFRLLSPELIIAKNTLELTRFLGAILNPNLEKTVRKENPTPTNTIKKIMADFCLLRLARAISLDDEAWELTEYGREVFAAYRLRQMSRAIHRAQQEKSAEV